MLSRMETNICLFFNLQTIFMRTTQTDTSKPEASVPIENRDAAQHAKK